MTIIATQHFPPGFRLINATRLNDLLNNPIRSSETGITATASGTQATSYQLGAYYNVVSTVASANDGVKLPVSQPGMEVTILNASANAITVFGTSPDTIDGAATATGVIQAGSSQVTYRCTSANTWLSTQNAVISAAMSPSTANAGTVRAIIGSISPTNSSITAGTLAGIRGVATLPTGKTIAGGVFLIGNQGKLFVNGTMNHADSRLAAMMAQLDTTGATLTTGQISALWVDHGAGVTGAGGGQFNMIRITNTVSGSKPNAVIYSHGNATYLLDLSAPGGTMDWQAAAGTSAGSAGESGKCEAPKVLIINVGGTPWYIPAFTQNT